MPTSIRLDTRSEQIVARIARQRRSTRSAVIRDAILALGRGVEGTERSAYSVVEHLIGSIDSGGRQLSVRTGAKVRELLMAKRRASSAR
jgi:hypothetical protein